MRDSKDYSISVVYKRVGDSLEAELVAFWIRHGAMTDPAEARRRAPEVLCVARDAKGEIAAVNSIYVAAFRGPSDLHYFYRQFARPRDRVVGLGVAMLREAAAFLRATHRSGDPVKGMLLVAENPKLSRKSGHRQLARLGWTFLGKGPRGFDLWRIDFSDPQPPRSPAGP